MKAEPNGSKTLTEQQFYHMSYYTWLGYPIQKNALDLMAYQQLIYDIKPDVLIETGSGHGGSALYFATIMDAVNHGIVITIDTVEWNLRPRHHLIHYLTGSSIDETLVQGLKNYVGEAARRMVILDSLHTKEHVLKELDLYGPLVTKNSYMIIEDANINGHGIRPDFGEGPWEAVHEWLPNHPEFDMDKNVEPPISNAPDGWLRKAY